MTDIKEQTPEELKKAIAEKREALRQFRFGGAGSRTRNVREGRALRKDIARILTELRARELVQAKKTA
ncbi:50S ribosomal protein L29 [Candidatus Kaiserbacteria bacterium RIFCSPHIGHO2_01_FULL_55_17]|uniref:Large ribosomal subunit protein uL29 n=1 Tax=Candidatus Kaiserbacteria bacterium RIFCSPHIGHO2_01_FULL_55_17 TaxID=1798484 RepID=A0A1F6D835_9BACT|nr:MAG: 50S ribosomal protein L29 [Candidatus Kaiserbacteria bacterium RIFCSPHIGHO2_01_FULL_55_17]